MAGVKGRSGKKSEPMAPGAFQVSADELTSEGGVVRVAQRLAEALAAGRVDPRSADSVSTVLRVALSAQRQSNELAREKRIEAMLERAEALEGIGRAREASQRKNRALADGVPVVPERQGDDLPPIPKTRSKK